MFGKHFASTYTGSMYGAGAVVFAVWGYIIAHTVDSRVELNPMLLGATLGIPPDDVESTLTRLCQPDPKSRNKEHDGRRLVHEEAFTYFVPSHAKYRAIRCEEDRRSYNREAQQRFRERRKADIKTPVNDSNSLSSVSAHTEYRVQKQSTEAEVLASLAPSEPPPAKPAKPKAPAENVDAEWIASLQAEPVNAGIDVKDQLAKAQFWCKHRGRKCTRKFFIGWLTRADREVAVPSTIAPAPSAPKTPGQYIPPVINPAFSPPDDHWRQVARQITTAPMRREPLIERLDQGTLTWDWLNDYEKREIVRRTPYYQPAAYLNYADLKN